MGEVGNHHVFRGRILQRARIEKKKMDAQTWISLILVGLAGGYLGWKILRFFRGLAKGKCGGGCGCGTVKKKAGGDLIPPEELVLRRRG